MGKQIIFDSVEFFLVRWSFICIKTGDNLLFWGGIKREKCNAADRKFDRCH